MMPLSKNARSGLQTAIALFLLASAPGYLRAQQQDVRNIVEAWYNTLCGEQMHLQAAYAALSPAFRAQHTFDAFERNYANIHHVELAELHLGATDGGHARVLVEDKRVATLDGVSAMVWYAGFLTLNRNGPAAQGAWQIASIDLTPEDLFGPRYNPADHWRTDPEQAAKHAVAGNSGDVKLCPDKMQSEPGDIHALRVFVCTDKRHVLDMAHLTNGAWVLFNERTEPLPAANVKGAAPAAPTVEGP